MRFTGRSSRFCACSFCISSGLAIAGQLRADKVRDGSDSEGGAMIEISEVVSLERSFFAVLMPKAMVGSLQEPRSRVARAGMVEA